MIPLPKLLTVLLLALALVVGCGDDESPSSSGTTSETPKCEMDERRCVNDEIQVCSAGQWTSLSTCPSGQECKQGDCVPECSPSCDGRMCGSDSCGGECGPGCEGDAICTAEGQCFEPAMCGNGACGADEDCANCPADCGCENGEVCDAGQCIEEVCTPQCDGRTCGPDGCDGECGPGCEGDDVCSVDGQCIPPSDSCGDNTCDPDEDCATCPADCGNCCGDGMCSDERGEDCATCVADCGCENGEVCDAGQCIEEVCTPQCDGRTCGPDGCDGECGPGCEDDDVCSVDGQCVPPSDSCGDDTCDPDEDCATCPADCGTCCGDGACSDDRGENCATCPADCACDDGDECNINTRICEEICVPQCDGRQCGPDACDGECGPGCGNGFECTNDGLCEEICVPQCDGRQCGPDACDGECGPGCEDDEVCRSDGACVPEVASCQCTDSQTCVDGICREQELICNTQNPTGLCENGFECLAGSCTEISGARCSESNTTGICPVGSICLDGLCEVLDGETLCNDNNACTQDLFDGARNGCVYIPLDTNCDDGNACTQDTCVEGVCVGEAVDGCTAPPMLDPFVTPTNDGALVLSGSKPMGSSVEINDQEAVPESPETTWSVELNLTPGENVYVIRTVDMDQPSETIEITVVYDIEAPTTRITPDGGVYLNGLTATVASDEPAEIFYTTDGGEPDAWSERFFALRQFRVFDDTRLRFRARDLAGNWEEEIVEVTFEITGEKSRWSDGPTLPEALTLVGAAFHAPDSSVYVVGGSDGLAPQAGAYRYNPEDESWMTLPSLPGARSQVAVVSFEGTLYAIGGEDDGTPLNGLLAFSPDVDDAWRSLPPMPSTRFGLAAVVHDRLIYAFGGKSNGGTVLNNVEIYNPAGDNWTNDSAPMPRARHAFQAISWRERIYIVGGEDAEGTPIAEVDIYNPEDDSWSLGAPMPTPRAFAATGLNTNLGEINTGYAGIVVAGGRELGGAPSARVEEYILNDDAWRERTPLDTPRLSGTGVAVVDTAGVDSERLMVWVVGGQNADGLTDNIATLVIEQDFVRHIENMPMERFMHGAAALNEKIYVLGGRSFQEEASAWEYDPETHTTTVLPDLPGLQNGSGVVAADGRLFVIGGANNFGNPVATVSAFDPSTRTWDTQTPMTTARSFPAITVLDDEIYVIGGSNNGAVQSVEIYSVAEDSWRSGPALPAGRTGSKAVTHHGAIVLVGGRDTNDAVIDSILYLAPESDDWDDSTITARVAISDTAVAQVHDEQLVIFGGKDDATLQGQIWRIDLLTSAAEVQSELTTALHFSAAAYVNGSIYLLGGNETLSLDPPGTALVQKIEGRCFNGQLDGREDEIDGGGGCAPQPLIYNASFQGNIGAAQCNPWRSFRSDLATATRRFNQITIRGSRDMTGRTCTGSMADTLCKNLGTATNTELLCDGQVWRIGECGSNSGNIEINAGRISICSCSNLAYSVRPCIGGDNWGGINSDSCQEVAQSMEVICR